MTVYGKQCGCGNRMDEVVGGYHCSECGTIEAYDWEEEDNLHIFGVLGFLAIMTGIIIFAVRFWGE